MAQTARNTEQAGWRRLTLRARAALGVPPAPDYPAAPADPREEWHRGLDRVRSLLEATRVSIERDGWTQGAWFTVERAGGGVRPIGGTQAWTLAGQLHRSTLHGCLVGTMLRLAEDPDSPHTHRDVWQGVNELYEAVREASGGESYPAGRVSAPSERRLRLQALTAWNDAAHRTRADVLGLLDRSISRTIVAACGR